MRTKMFTVSIQDCEVQTFRSGGKGGQNQNKRDTGVRVIHAPSGAVGEAREFRSQLENKRAAFLKMGKSSRFQSWAKIGALDLAQQLEQRVNEMMKQENLLIEEIKG